MSSTHPSISRRDLLAMAGIAAVSAGTSSSIATAAAPTSTKYPKGFLWGVSTAGHQVEGSNTNSDIWFLEHVKPSIFKESSNDACDHYQRYAEDIALLAGLGFNCFRFSLEWARIEPAQGEFLFAELEHYRRVMATCREHGVAPMVTFNHGAAPRWFAALGGWENPQAPDLFARFCERATAHCGDLIGVASTLNEPNIGLLLEGWLGLPAFILNTQQAMLDAAARAAASNTFSTMLAGHANKTTPILLEAHRKGYAAIKAGRGEFPVGVNLAIMDDQAVGENSLRDRKRAECYEPWLAAAAQNDYVAVQTYGRSRIDKNGLVAPEAGVELTQTGEEFYPEGLEQTIRYAAKATGKPVYVSENGIATEDDTRRVEYIKRAVAGVERCLADGIDVRSYMHWSLLDNFEWIFGFGPKFGLVAVDRATQKRTAKPSARYLGNIARSHGSRAATRK